MPLAATRGVDRVITLIGLGAGDAETVSRGAERALRDASDATRRGAGTLFVRTARHPSAAVLSEWGLAFASFDALYEAAADFKTLYAEIADRVLAEARR